MLHNPTSNPLGQEECVIVPVISYKKSSSCCSDHSLTEKEYRTTYDKGARQGIATDAAMYMGPPTHEKDHSVVETIIRETPSSDHILNDDMYNGCLTLVYNITFTREFRLDLHQFRQSFPRRKILAEYDNFSEKHLYKDNPLYVMRLEPYKFMIPKGTYEDPQMVKEVLFHDLKPMYLWFRSGRQLFRNMYSACEVQHSNTMCLQCMFSVAHFLAYGRIPLANTKKTISPAYPGCPGPLCGGILKLHRMSSAYLIPPCRSHYRKRAMSMIDMMNLSRNNGNKKAKVS